MADSALPLFGKYRGKGMVSFEGVFSNVKFGATVSLDQFKLTCYGPIPKSENVDVDVYFVFVNFKPWPIKVPVPYLYAQYRFHWPPLPSQPGKASLQSKPYL
ncbi:hypothetical protein BDW59DRAFT_155478 [Aspergillus cavernicola]|uniref:Arrestin-like N-terminal domain-containing protein n=1 Tax=Aspergillus cavernicola TaxID=176166 RepID=A0ABR4H8E7_9EURO